MDDDTTTPATKTKQERIRDNQRRSRARRQEYLADLERRLSECHVTCREADIQKQALGQLQMENARLRELLAYAGISIDLIESYVAQDFTPGTIDAASPLRQIKPKIGHASEISKPHPFGFETATETSSSCTPEREVYGQSARVSGPGQPPPTIIIPQGPPQHVNITRSPAYHQNQSPASGRMSYSPHPGSYPQGTPTTPSTTENWQQHQFYQHYPHNSHPQRPRTEVSMHSQHFHMTVDTPHAPMSQNAAFSSVARDMIDKHQIKAEDIEDMKHRLYSNAAQTNYTGPGLNIDNQAMFQILNELSTRQG